MAQKGLKRQMPKHIPQRMCVGCRTNQPKRELIRIVRNSQNIIIDPIGKMIGRGAYLHNQKNCWDQALRGALARALKIELTAEDYERLSEYAQTLPE